MAVLGYSGAWEKLIHEKTLSLKSRVRLPFSNNWHKIQRGHRLGFPLSCGPSTLHIYTTNKGPVRIQYKCLVPIYVFPEKKLLFTKQNYNVLSPRSYTHISVKDFYISRIGLPILIQRNMYVDRSWKYMNRSQTHNCGNWDGVIQRPLRKRSKMDARHTALVPKTNIVRQH